MRPVHRFPASFLASSLALLSLAAPRPGRAADHRLDHTVVPTFQSIHLRLDPSQTDYMGSVHIDLSVASATDSFRLYARDMMVSGMTLKRGTEEIPVRSESGREGLLIVRAARPLAPGSYGLDISFTNDFDTKANALYRLQANGDWYAFTQFEADAAREAFPCWDEPEFKIPFQLTLVVPKQLATVSNTPIESAKTVGSEQTVTFARTPPLPSYLVAIAVGPLEFTPIRGMSIPGRVVTIKGASRLAAEAARVTPPLVAALEKYFGRKYPYAKLDLLAVPEFAAGAMENAGAITYRDEVLLVDPVTASPRQKYGMLSTTAHELAHMWFGDLVTMEWWDDVWLNESFASWMGSKVTQEVAPQYQTPVRDLHGRQNALTTDARPSTRAIRQRVDAFDNFDILFDELAYDKGQAVLEMLESWLGPETFRKGILRYLDAHAWKNATAADLWKALSEASGKDIAAITASFLEQPGVPIVGVEPLAGGQVRLTQRRFRNIGDPGAAAPDSTRWKIPVVLEYSDGRQVYTQSVLLGDGEQTVALEKTREPAWIHPNAGERGYYRWSVPAPMLDRIVAAGAQALDTRERVALLGNTGALLDGGVLHGDVYVRTLAHMADDPAAEVVGAALDGLTKVRRTFVTPAVEGTYLVGVRKMLHPPLARFGMARAKGEAEPVTLMRPNLLTTLAVHGNDPQVRAWARTAARTYLTNPGAVDPGLAGSALEIAARDGDDSLFQAYRARFEATKIPAERNRYLTAIGSFRRPDLIEKALAYTLAGPLRPQELLVIPRQVATENDALRDHVWEWLKSNYAAIASRVPPFFVSQLTSLANGCDEARIEDARTFFTVLVHSPTGTMEELAKVCDQIRDCAALRRREGPAVLRGLTEVLTAKTTP
jgi:cytosol alanyl aminopeptidase